MREALLALTLAIVALPAAQLVAKTPAYAVNPDEMLSDPVLEARARKLSEGLRCLVCQNESIDASNAALAKDLRLLVRRRIKAGDTDQQVIDYLVSRYGEFVLLKPRFEIGTLALWGTPVVVLLAGFGLAVVTIRGRKGARRTERLSADEERAIAKMMSERDRPVPRS